MRLALMTGDGMLFHCYLCDSNAKARHSCSPDTSLGKVEHVHNDKHKK